MSEQIRQEVMFIQERIFFEMENSIAGLLTDKTVEIISINYQVVQECSESSLVFTCIVLFKRHI